MENKQIGGQKRNGTSKKREREKDCLSTFLKYRDDLYKEASELCTLCGVELALIISSPSGELYAFGHPNFEMVVDRFLDSDTKRPIGGTGDPVEDARLKASIEALNKQLMQLQVQKEIERERAKVLAKLAAIRRTKLLTNTNIDELSPEDTQKLKAWLLELKEKIREHREKLVASAPPTAVASNDASSGSSSGYAGAGSLGYGLGGMP
ncbi:agamous-like MADS-box protein AGL62 [Diospyros lotus]|uniref:agamous-like MADS-box protein AGL62 n=1 Tax=Diospyros lotus TaxID=55363 RepID=UPI0022532687|nr:agamous-like MADS-box protein AGL62 [Diospyros lotus]